MTTNLKSHSLTTSLHYKILSYANATFAGIRCVRKQLDLSWNGHSGCAVQGAPDNLWRKGRAQGPW